MPTLYSYVVATDSGAAPNPFGSVCTLVICKPDIRRTAKIGDWIVGTGSVCSPMGDLQGQVVYAMRVSAKIPMSAYDELAREHIPIKVPGGDSPSPLSRVGDAIYDFSETPPRLQRSSVHCEEDRGRDLGGEYALLSEHFYYFGAQAKPLPDRLQPIVKKGQGHRSNANDDHVEDFIEWIEGLGEEPNRIHGRPAELKDFNGFEEALARIGSSGLPKKTSEVDTPSKIAADSSPEDPASDHTDPKRKGPSADVSADELRRLKRRSGHPNARTAAYICGMVLQDQLDDLDHGTLVTSANMAALLAWDRGVDLSNLDPVRFNVLRPSGGPPHLEIERGADSASVPVVERRFSLDEPWEGFYRISKVVQGTREAGSDPRESSPGPSPEASPESSSEASSEASSADAPADGPAEPPMEAVWQNWKTGSSCCEGCPGQEALYPLGGLGDPDSDLMLIGKEPAYNVNENTVRGDMSWPEAKQAMERDRRSHPNPLQRQMRTVADAAGLSGPADLYFTNSAKCNDGKCASRDSEGSSWEERYGHCQGYLLRELETVSPSVLLLYGRHAIDVAFEAHGLDSPSKVSDVHTQPRQTSGRTLVPLFHWAHPAREGWIDRYNQEVARLVRSLLRTDSL